MLDLPPLACYLWRHLLGMPTVDFYFGQWSKKAFLENGKKINSDWLKSYKTFYVI